MKTAAIFVAAAGLVAARPELLNSSYDVAAGQPFTIQFSGCDGGCTITLETGPKDNLKPVQTLAASATGGSVTVNINEVPTDSYAFRIVNNETGEFNFSPQFDLEGGAPASTTEVVTTTEVPETTSTEETTSAEQTTTAEETTTEASTTIEETTTVEPSTTSAESTTLATVTSSEVETTTTPASTTSEEETSTSSSAEETSSPTEVPDSGVGRLASPLALVAGAVGAMLFFN